MSGNIYSINAESNALCRLPPPPFTPLCSPPFLLSRQLKFSQLALAFFLSLPPVSFSFFFFLSLSLSLLWQINRSHVSSFFHSVCVQLGEDTALSGLGGVLSRAVIGWGRETAARRDCEWQTGIACLRQKHRASCQLLSLRGEDWRCRTRTECLAGCWTSRCEGFRCNTLYICFASTLSPHV